MRIIANDVSLETGTAGSNPALSALMSSSVLTGQLGQRLPLWGLRCRFLHRQMPAETQTATAQAIVAETESSKPVASP